METEASGFLPTLLVAVANPPSYGGGMKIAPQGQLNDGKLDVCVVGPMKRLKLAALLPTVYAGGHLGLSGVEYRRGERLRVETASPAAINADGGYVALTPARRHSGDRGDRAGGANSLRPVLNYRGLWLKTGALAYGFGC